MKKIDIELTNVQFNILAAALGHMWEYLDELEAEGLNFKPEERKVDLREMQEKFKV